MMRPTATELLQTIDATLDQKVEPSLSDVGGRSALATVRHLLNFVRVRIEREGQLLTNDVAELRNLLPEMVDYFATRGEGGAAEAVRQALAKPGPQEPGRYLSLDELAEVAGGLREALHRALSRLQDMRDLRGGEPQYIALRSAIRAYVARQIENEGEIVGPAFFGRGPRR